MKTHIINGEFTIYTAATEKQALQILLDENETIEVNLAQVTDMDSAGLQILIALKSEAVKNHKQVSYVMHSKAVLDILEMTNMVVKFGDQIVLT